MPVIREGQAPYAPVEAVMTVIDGYRIKHPPTPFTTENIQPLGVASSIAPRTLQALRLLDLVDEAGEPTAAMDVLREASNAELPARLAEIVRAAYAEVFAYKDPAQDSPEEMAEVFRFYKPPSMQPRMVRLFFGLCVRAGIIEAAPAIQGSGGSSKRKAPGSKANAKTPKPAGGEGPAPAPLTPPAPRTSMDAAKARYLDVLLDKLQAADGGLDADLADRIERLIEAEAKGKP